MQLQFVDAVQLAMVAYRHELAQRRTTEGGPGAGIHKLQVVKAACFSQLDTHLLRLEVAVPPANSMHTTHSLQHATEIPCHAISCLTCIPERGDLVNHAKRELYGNEVSCSGCTPLATTNGASPDSCAGEAKSIAQHSTAQQSTLQHPLYASM